MSTTSNKELVRRAYEELVNRGNYDCLEAFCHEEYYDYTQPPGWPTDRAGLHRQLQYFRSAFPDINVTFQDIIAEDDVVMLRQTMRGTHLGEFFGIPPTGKPVAMTGSHLFRIKDGKLVEHHANNDDLGMLRQLGAIPSPIGE